MQQINLLLALPKPEKLALSAQSMLKAVGGVVVGLFLVLGVFKFLEISDQKQLEEAQAGATAAGNYLQETTERYPGIIKNEQLAAEVNNLAAEVEEKARLLKRVTDATRLSGFSEYLVTLAEQTPAQIALQHIQIQQPNGQVTLMGRSVSPGKVAQLVQSLSELPLFTEKEFKMFHLVQQPDKSRVDFKLGTVVAEE